MRKYSHIDLFLTTHYVSICDKWVQEKTDSRKIQNYQMIVDTIDNKRVPTYKISQGISRIEGAIDILTNMDYPPEIIAMFESDEVTV